MMRFLYKVIFLVVSLNVILVDAQLDKFQFHLGGSYEFISITGNGLSYYPPYMTISGGAHYGLWHSNDQIALSLNPNAQIGLSYNSFTGMSFLGQLPCFVMLRAGAACNPFNEQKFGAGIGGGFNFTYLNEKYAAVINNTIYGVETNFITPSVAAQLTFQNQVRILTLRFHSSIYPYSTRFVAPFNPLKFNYLGYGLSLLYNF